MTPSPRPGCPDCQEGTLICPVCDDRRPTAADLDIGWRLRTPFGRWETVTDVRQDNPYAPIQVRTVESGPDLAWPYPRWRHLDAHPADQDLYGTPEIRVVEYDGAAAPMYAVATRAGAHPDVVTGEGILATASRLSRLSNGQVQAGWQVCHQTRTDKPVVVACGSKAKARTQLRRMAGEYAKAYKVPLRLP
jgi:hypothetical protein